MNRFLTDNVVDTPIELMRVTRDQRFHRDFALEVELKEKGKPHSDAMLERLAIRPAVYAAYVSANLCNDPDRPRAIAAVTSPTHAFNIVAYKIDFYFDFAALICSDLETVEQMVYLVRTEPGGVGPVAVSDLLKLLEGDPNRLVRATDKVDRDSVHARCLSAANRKKYSSAAWAYFWLAYQKMPDEDPNVADTRKKVSSRLIETLRADEQYAYRGLLLLRNRVENVAPKDWSNLQNAIVSPRWAYHAMADALLWVGDGTVCGYEILYSDPEWLVQFFTCDKLSIEDVRNHVAESILRNLFGHPMISDLQDWIQLFNESLPHPLPGPARES